MGEILDTGLNHPSKKREVDDLAEAFQDFDLEDEDSDGSGMIC